MHDFEKLDNDFKSSIDVLDRNSCQNIIKQLTLCDGDSCQTDLIQLTFYQLYFQNRDVVAAEQSGLDEVWLADEGVAREPMTVLAAAATRTERIRLGVGITSPLLRHAGALAATAATLDELSVRRAVLGLGVGGSLSLAPFGLTAERPVRLLSEAIETARDVLARRPGRSYDPPAHAMPARDVPIWVGARGPQLTRLAARRADGLFLSGCTDEQHARIVTAARSERAGIGIALYRSAASGDGRDSVTDWAGLTEHLVRDHHTWAPTALGVNLVELNDGSRSSATALVERAARHLHTATGR